MAVTNKGLTKTEMKLLNDFSNTVNAREYSENVKIKKLTLTYDELTGFSVELVETSSEVNTDPEQVTLSA